MLNDSKKLNIINEIGKIIGEDTRENIHKKGLLHREVNVWFYTPKGEILFQHRAKKKDTYPDLLDATAGGHVELGMGYEDAALQEIKEETGLVITRDQLTFIGMLKMKMFDRATSNINYVLKGVYGYCYGGEKRDLRVEKGRGVGFEAWPLDQIFNLPCGDRKKFIPFILEEKSLNILRKIQALYKTK